jgi:hypothetical protein
MNIFILDNDTALSAQYHCDKHISKMIIESCQLLSTCYSEQRAKDLGLYKRTHYNHPCALWVRESMLNVEYLFELATSLCIEYHHRYHKTHATWAVLRKMIGETPCNVAMLTTRTPFRLCMPDAYKIADDPVLSYRKYYVSKRHSFNMNWTNRNRPKWFTEMVDSEHLITYKG